MGKDFSENTDYIDYNFELDESKPMPWEQRVEEGESDVWHRRLMHYISLKGAARNVSNAYRTRDEGRYYVENDIVDGRWYKIARTWKWVERARAYDEYQQLLLAKEARELRLEKLQELSKVIEKAYKVFDPESADVSLQALVKGFATFLQESRSEHNALPVQKVAKTDATGKDTNKTESLNEALKLLEIAKQRKKLAEQEDETNEEGEV